MIIFFCALYVLCDVRFILVFHPVRTILTTWNYDYIIDHVFHLDGSIELRASTTGYLQSTFWSPQLKQEAEKFGFRIHDFTSGTLHDHILCFKIDLDVGGLNNSVMKSDVRAIRATPQDINGVPYANRLSYFQVSDDYKTKQIFRSLLPLESGVTMFPSHPASYSIINKHRENSWGAKKGYRLRLNGVIQNLVADTKAMAAYSFSKHTFAVTRRHEEERSCSSIYDQADPTGTVFNATHPTPLVSLDRYINGEGIDDTDIVLWANVGVQHITDAEDIPVTNSIGNVIQVRVCNTINEFDSLIRDHVSRCCFCRPI